MFIDFLGVLGGFVSQNVFGNCLNE
jgi:hypothetical protein